MKIRHFVLPAIFLASITVGAVAAEPDLGAASTRESTTVGDGHSDAVTPPSTTMTTPHAMAAPAAPSAGNTRETQTGVTGDGGGK